MKTPITMHKLFNELITATMGLPQTTTRTNTTIKTIKAESVNQ